MGAKIALKILSISASIILIIAVIFGLYKLGGYCFEYGYRVYTEPAMTTGEGQDMLVQTTSITSLRDLAENLEAKGLIRDWKLFWIQAKISGYDVKPGIFTVNTSMTAFEMMKVMTPPEVEESDEETDSTSSASDNAVEAEATQIKAAEDRLFGKEHPNEEKNDQRSSEENGNIVGIGHNN